VSNKLRRQSARPSRSVGVYGGRVTVLMVPFHLDEQLPRQDFPAGVDRVVTADVVGETAWERVACLQAAVADAVAGAGNAVVLSGDCTVSLGVVAGLQRRGVDPAVVWFDAHGDIHTPQSSTSGYLGGMPLRMLLGEGDPAVASRVGLRAVPADRVVLVGARDLDPPEVAYLASSPVVQAPVDAVTDPGGPLYVHVDLDVVDPDVLPRLRFPAAGGPDLEAVRDAVLALIGTGRVAALTLACTWQPGSPAAEAARPLLATLIDASTPTA
jgi:arginase